MDSRVGEERRKGYFLLLYLKVLFFSTLFLYLCFSFLFDVCRANLKHVLTSVSLFTWWKILDFRSRRASVPCVPTLLCPFYVSSRSSFPQEGGHRPGHFLSKPRGSEVSNLSQVHLGHMANFPILQRRLRSKTLSKSRGKPRTAASWPCLAPTPSGTPGFPLNGPKMDTLSPEEQIPPVILAPVTK